jgi:hypothetical protein
MGFSLCIGLVTDLSNQLQQSGGLLLAAGLDGCHTKITISLWKW